MAQQGNVSSWLVIGSVALGVVGIPTGVYIARQNSSPADLAARVDEIRARENEESVAVRHQDLSRRIEEYQQIARDSGFARLPQDKQGFVQSRSQELEAYQAYRNNLDALEKVKVASDSEIASVQSSLASLTVPDEYREEWRATDAGVRQAALEEDLKILAATVQQTRHDYQEVIRAGEQVLMESAAPNLPSRARQVLDRARALPSPGGDVDKPLPGAKQLTYSNVFQFHDIQTLIDAKWRPIQQKLKQIAVLDRP